MVEEVERRYIGCASGPKQLADVAIREILREVFADDVLKSDREDRLCDQFRNLEDLFVELQVPTV
jgi:hypothetical protein